MSKSVIVNGTTYILPISGDPSGWGDNLSALLEGLVAVAGSVSTVGDIFTTSFAINNNVTTPTAITGLSFNPATIRSAIVSLSIHRATSSQERSETSQAFIAYSTISNSFELSQAGVGNAEVALTIDSTGQVYYTSSNLSGLSHSGMMKFSAKISQQ